MVNGLETVAALAAVGLLAYLIRLGWRVLGELDQLRKSGRKPLRPSSKNSQLKV